MNCQRVLSIQSHVVSGYVGNKSATFPLQILGFDVDSINSVQFSNHTGYSHFRGQVLDADQLGDLYQGLVENAINSYSHLLTGYIGSESFLLKVCDVVKDLKLVNEGLIYVCDPVLGDNGKMYVPAELLPIYKEKIVPLADILTPNQFEAQLLTDIEIKDELSAAKAMKKLHEMGAKTVVLTSSELGNGDVLVALASSVTGQEQKCIRITMPKLDASFTGSGDLFAALLLAWLHKHPADLKLACEKTISTMQHVLRRTLESANELSAEKRPSPRQLELRLVQSKNHIENPEMCVKAEVTGI